MAGQTPEQRQLEAITGHLQHMTQVITALEDRMNRIEAASNEASTSNKGKEPAMDDPPKEDEATKLDDEEEPEDSNRLNLRDPKTITWRALSLKSLNLRKNLILNFI